MSPPESRDEYKDLVQVNYVGGVSGSQRKAAWKTRWETMERCRIGLVIAVDKLRLDPSGDPLRKHVECTSKCTSFVSAKDE